ncbi:hypothetical protein [Synechococcus sp. BA-132 BA5]|uniref:hypothetical protein n=1 Tax=Synechococcus sp. BA-132 BA5 TaxID=3110252 RepID=UPI002B20D7BD|nr:hypothetical protein [Synechococcus sp. BA-132 BA5]MEA5416497.1 hypothetical protein [Synechococcus sp. BA-132 BA5]
MKTTLDLPDHLVRQAKQRALQQGRTLKELVAEYIRHGLHGVPCPPVDAACDQVTLDPAGLPVFRSEPASGRPEIDLATALQLEQQALALEDLRRAGLSS